MSSGWRLPLTTNYNTEAARSSLENDTIHTDSIVLPGRDSVPEIMMPPDETESSLTDTLGVAETSDLATPRYGKRPSDNL